MLLVSRSWMSRSRLVLVWGMVVDVFVKVRHLIVFNNYNSFFIYNEFIIKGTINFWLILRIGLDSIIIKELMIKFFN